MSTAEAKQGAASGTAEEEPAPHRRGPVMEVLRKLLVEGGAKESVAQAVLALEGDRTQQPVIRRRSGYP